VARKRRVVVIPKEQAIFRLDGYGNWQGPDGPFQNRRIIEHFHRSIRRDEQGYHLAQTHRDWKEKVYFPYEDAVLFVMGVVKGEDIVLLLNTGRRVRLRPRNLFVKDDDLYMRVGNEIIKFSDRGLIPLADFLEEEGEGERLFIRVKGRRYRIREDGAEDRASR